MQQFVVSYLSPTLPCCLQFSLHALSFNLSFMFIFLYICFKHIYFCCPLVKWKKFVFSRFRHTCGLCIFNAAGLTYAAYFCQTIYTGVTNSRTSVAAPGTKHCQAVASWQYCSPVGVQQRWGNVLRARGKREGEGERRREGGRGRQNEQGVGVRRVPAGAYQKVIITISTRLFRHSLHPHTLHLSPFPLWVGNYYWVRHAARH